MSGVHGGSPFLPRRCKTRSAPTGGRRAPPGARPLALSIRSDHQRGWILGRERQDLAFAAIRQGEDQDVPACGLRRPGRCWGWRPSATTATRARPRLTAVHTLRCSDHIIDRTTLSRRSWLNRIFVVNYTITDKKNLDKSGITRNLTSFLPDRFTMWPSSGWRAGCWPRRPRPGAVRRNWAGGGLAQRTILSASCPSCSGDGDGDGLARAGFGAGRCRHCAARRLAMAFAVSTRCRIQSRTINLALK